MTRAHSVLGQQAPVSSRHLGQRGRRSGATALLTGLLVIGCSSAGDTTLPDPNDAMNSVGMNADTGDGAPREAPDATGPDDALAQSTGPSPGEPCLNAGTEGATATCLSPTQTADYYVDQAERYFDTLDVTADPERVPLYSERVARWEWPPWLLLTAYGSQDMIDTNKALHSLDPSTVPTRDCRAFDVQPFARCTVVFAYDDGPCPIYEEFTFNDAGEMTFIEAWSDVPGLRPQADEQDPWGERSSLGRLATRVPGLGNAQGLISLESSWMTEAATEDDDVADFALRASDWWVYWYEAFTEAPTNFFAQGCGW
jgi:hypothetical protein